MTLSIPRTHETPDVAAFTMASGLHVICYVWADRARHSIESMITTVTEDGDEVVLHQSTVRVESPGEDPFEIDTPKIFTRSGLFIVHYVVGQEGSGGTLYQAWIDPDNIDAVPTWTQHAGPSLSDAWLHDVHVIEGTSDWAVAYLDDTDDLVVRRDTALAWPVSPVWSNNYGVDAAGHVLTVWGNSSHNCVMAVYEGTGGTANTLQAVRMSASAGTGSAQAAILDTPASSSFTQATICTQTSTAVRVVAEGHIADSSDHVNYVIHGSVNTTTLADGTSEPTYNIGLLSRAWPYISSTTNRINIYCVVGHRPIREDDMTSRNAFVVCLDGWPRPVVNLTSGTLDTRMSGAAPVVDHEVVADDSRRSNHVSSAAPPPPYSYRRKSRTVALLTFQRAMRVDAAGMPDGGVIPTQATVIGHHVVLEDPFYTDRGDAEDNGALTASFKGTYPDLVQAFECGRGLWIGGGTPHLYDGSQTVECGYCWAPDCFRMTMADASFSGTPPADYSFVWTYEWTDRQGQLHRSGPSAPFLVEESDFLAYNTGRMTFRVSTMTLSLRDDSDRFEQATPINVVTWMTINGGTTYYRLFSSASDTSYSPGETTVNDREAHYVSVVVDWQSMGALQRHEVFPYTLGPDGAWTPTEPQSVPAFIASTFWQNRVVGIPAEDPRTIWPSMEILPAAGAVPPTAPEFNAALVFRIDDLAHCTGLATVDDTLVMFTRDGVYGFTGYPADNLGQNASLEVRKYPSNYGCIDARSICVFPEGVMFQSHRGLCLMDRNGDVQYIGQDVEDLVATAGNIRAATHLEDRNEVRFVCNGGPSDSPLVLSYDYKHHLWARHVMPTADLPGGTTGFSSAVHGNVWRGPNGEQLHVVLEESAVLVERPTTDATPWADSTRTSTQAVDLDIQTGWLALAGINGYKRVWYLGILFEVHNDCTVRVTVDSELLGNFSTATQQVFTEDLTTTRQYLKLPLATQLCSAIRVRVQEYSPSTIPTTRNVGFVGMSIYFGRHMGDRRVPDSQVGT